MPTRIVVPHMGESVVEATVARWLKREGDRVHAGETVVELETEKVDLEVGAEQAGVLVQIGRREGEAVQVGDVLGVIEEAPETITEAALARSQGPATSAAEHAVPPVQPAGKEMPPTPKTEATPSGAAGPAPGVTQSQAEPRPERRRPGPEAAPAEPAAIPGRGEREERVRMSRRRQTIARRLVEAQRAAAMLTTFNEIDMGSVQELRARRQDAFQTRHGVKLGIMSFFVKATVAALKAFPRLNAEIQGEEMLLKHYYDIGIAVGASEGLVVPVLRDADGLSFAQIEEAVKALAQKVEESTLSLEDLRGGTFTITNGGVFGSLLSTPILNPPQVGILGLHKIEDRPISRQGSVIVRPMMYAALSYDHRIVDGREAVQFLVRVKELIEHPEDLLLES
jgi:2-oxoglutarate dehydrogenase E2 component (dihydrolipoamide succinyltransferase)